MRGTLWWDHRFNPRPLNREQNQLEAIFELANKVNWRRKSDPNVTKHQFHHIEKSEALLTTLIFFGTIGQKPL